MEINRILVTPIIANNYLQGNTISRNLKANVVAHYAQQMSKKEWKEDTGETIKISKNGIVLDGQHRLHAIVKSNTNLHFHVFKELEDEVFDVLDTGRKRSAGDVFYIKEISNSNIIPSQIQLYTILKDNGISSKTAGFALHGTSANLLKLYNERSLFWDETAKQSLIWHTNFLKIIPPSVIGGIYGLLCDKNVEQAKSFMNQLCSGLNLTNDCIGLLRTKLIQDKVSNTKYSEDFKNALVIKTWNHFRNNDKVSLIKFSPNKEKFPIAI